MGVMFTVCPLQDSVTKASEKCPSKLWLNTKLLFPEGNIHQWCSSSNTSDVPMNYKLCYELFLTSILISPSSLSPSVVTRSSGCSILSISVYWIPRSLTTDRFFGPFSPSFQPSGRISLHRHYHILLTKFALFILPFKTWRWRCELLGFLSFNFEK